MSLEAILAPASSNAAESKVSEERGGARVCVLSNPEPQLIEEQNTSSPEVSFTTVIEQLKADKLRLTTELNESNDYAMKASELKGLAEEEVTRFNLMIQQYKELRWKSKYYSNKYRL